MKTVKKILVVDDDAEDALIFQEVLFSINASIQYSTAEDGKDALDQLRGAGPFLPDLIFLDLNMPRINGKECLKKIKEDEKLKDIPVIIYTTSSQPRDIEETMQAGACCFISKPLNIKDLESILQAIVGCDPTDLDSALQKLTSIATTIVCRDGVIPAA